MANTQHTQKMSKALHELDNLHLTYSCQGFDNLLLPTVHLWPTRTIVCCWMFYLLKEGPSLSFFQLFRPLKHIKNYYKKLWLLFWLISINSKLLSSTHSTTHLTRKTNHTLSFVTSSWSLRSLRSRILLVRNHLILRLTWDFVWLRGLFWDLLFLPYRGSVLVYRCKSARIWTFGRWSTRLWVRVCSWISIVRPRRWWRICYGWPCCWKLVQGCCICE